MCSQSALERLIDGVEVLRETVQDAARGREVEEGHGQAQHVLQELLVDGPSRAQAAEGEHRLGS